MVKKTISTLTFEKESLEVELKNLNEQYHIK